MLELSGVLGGALSLDLQLCNPRHQRSDLRSLRLDLSRLRQHQADQILLRQSVQRVAIHGYGDIESSVAVSSAMLANPASVIYRG